MFNRKTVLIVGAGASAEAKLPVGSTLALNISKKLDIRYDSFKGRNVGTGDMDLFEALRHAYPNRANEIQQACWRIRDGIHLVNSIDDFLDIHKHDPLVTLVGKAAIVQSILEAERGSLLFYDRSKSESMNFPNLHATWYSKLMKVLSPGTDTKNVARLLSNVSFIVFNYDRCIEHFLLHAIQRLYGESEGRAAELLKTATIKHPYGALAPLRTSIEPHGLMFGDTGNVNLLKMASNIKTYTEQVEDDEELASIRRLVREADCVIILGFGFHEQNMKLLGTGQKSDRLPFSFATAYKMSDSDMDRCFRKIQGMTATAPSHIKIQNNILCSELFDGYSKSIAG